MLGVISPWPAEPFTVSHRYGKPHCACLVNGQEMADTQQVTSKGITNQLARHGKVKKKTVQ